MGIYIDQWVKMAARAVLGPVLSGFLWVTCSIMMPLSLSLSLQLSFSALPHVAGTINFKLCCNAVGGFMCAVPGAVLLFAG